MGLEWIGVRIGDITTIVTVSCECTFLNDTSTQLMSVPSAPSGHTPITPNPRGDVNVAHLMSDSVDRPPGSDRIFLPVSASHMRISYAPHVDRNRRLSRSMGWCVGVLGSAASRVREASTGTGSDGSSGRDIKWVSRLLTPIHVFDVAAVAPQGAQMRHLHRGILLFEHVLLHNAHAEEWGEEQ